jgi:hypothetical protein
MGLRLDVGIAEVPQSDPARLRRAAPSNPSEESRTEYAA